MIVSDDFLFPWPNVLPLCRISKRQVRLLMSSLFKTEEPTIIKKKHHNFRKRGLAMNERMAPGQLGQAICTL